jgi:hypothetical protein
MFQPKSQAIATASRISALLPGKMRAHSLQALIAAEAHLSRPGSEGVIILRVIDGLTDMSFLPGVLAGEWSLTLTPTDRPVD